MHFSKGEIIFMIFFIVAFAGALVWSYIRDRKINRKYYPKAWLIILTTLLILVSLSLIIRFIHRH